MKESKFVFVETLMEMSCISTTEKTEELRNKARNTDLYLKLLDEINILGSYFLPWFKLSYWLFSVPFNVKICNEKNYVLTKNSFRKYFFFIMQMMHLLDVFFEIRGYMDGKSVNQDPGFFLRVIDRANSAVYTYSWFYTIWFKNNSRILGLFRVSSCGPKYSRPAIGFVIFMVCFSTYSNISAFFGHSLETADIEKSFYSRVQKFCLEYFLPRDRSSSLSEIALPVKVGSVFIYALRFYKWILLDLFRAICLITAIGAYRISRKFSQLVSQSGGSEAEVANVMDAYLKVREIFELLNEFIGPLYVPLFISCITFWSVSAAAILESETWSFPLIMGVYFFIFSSTFIILAEAHHQANHINVWMLRNRKGSVAHLMEYIEVESTNIAIKGGRLFTISYEFLGTACGVALTYAIIMIQFRSCCSPSSIPVK